MVDVIKRRITGVSADTVGAKIDMANIRQRLSLPRWRILPPLPQVEP